MAEKQLANLGCAIFLMLFGLPFFVVGLGAGTMIVFETWQWWQTASWEEAEATILDVKKRPDEGYDHIPCDALARYTYEYEGETFENDTVVPRALIAVDGPPSFKIYERLRAAQSQQRTLPCYVNPNNPAEAVLARPFGWARVGFLAVFFITFGGAGTFLIVGSLYGSRKLAREKARESRFPGQPWLWKEKWAEGTVKPEGNPFALLAVAIFVCALSAPVLFALPSKLAEKDYPILIALIFPLIGLGLLYVAILTILRHRRYGKSVLHLETLPGVIGGHLRGTLVVVGNLVDANELEIVLKNIHTYTTGTGKHRNTHHITEWESKRTLESYNIAQSSFETHIPFEFQIPYRCEPYNDSESSSKYTWQLEVKADVPGANLNLTFDVPVYRTEESDQAIGESDAYTEKVLSEETPAPRIIQVGRDANGNEKLTVLCWKGLGAFLVIPLLALVSVGLAIGGIVSGELILAGVGFVMFLFMILIFFSMVGEFRITFTAEGLWVERDYMLFTRTKMIPCDLIRWVEHETSGHSGSQAQYRVKISFHSGDDTTIVGGIPGKQPTEWLVYRIRNRLGLPEFADEEISGSDEEI